MHHRASATGLTFGGLVKCSADASMLYAAGWVFSFSCSIFAAVDVSLGRACMRCTMRRNVQLC